MKYSVIRASVQTIGVIDAAVTGLLLVAVVLIAVMVPTLCPRARGSSTFIRNETFRASSISLSGAASMPPHAIAAVVPPIDNRTTRFNYNSSDVYWWYYAKFEQYQNKLRHLGNMLDATFIFVLLVIVVSDVVLVKAAEGTYTYRHALGSVYYWIVCNMFVIMVLPVVSIFSLQIAGATGALRVCGVGCGLPYFYITYRLLYGLMVALYLTEMWRGNYICYKGTCYADKLGEIY